MRSIFCSDKCQHHNWYVTHRDIPQSDTPDEQQDLLHTIIVNEAKELATESTETSIQATLPELLPPMNSKNVTVKLTTVTGTGEQLAGGIIHIVEENQHLVREIKKLQAEVVQLREALSNADKKLNKVFVARIEEEIHNKD